VFPFESCLTFCVSHIFFHIYTLNHISLSSIPIFSFLPSSCYLSLLLSSRSFVPSFDFYFLLFSLCCLCFSSSVLILFFHPSCYVFFLLILTFSVLLYLKRSIAVLVEIFARRLFKSIQASSNRGKKSRHADILECPLKPLIYSPCQIF